MTPPPHKEAMELARIHELRKKLCDLIADEDLTEDKLRDASEGLLPNLHDALLKLPALLEQRDAQLWAEAIERAKQEVKKLFGANQDEDYTELMAAIYALQPSPHWLERERVKARIEEAEWWEHLAAIGHEEA